MMHPQTNPLVLGFIIGFLVGGIMMIPGYAIMPTVPLREVELLTPSDDDGGWVMDTETKIIFQISDTNPHWKQGQKVKIPENKLR